jgi:hypothetical protein
MILSNGVFSLKVPASQQCAPSGEGQILPAPMLAMQQKDGPWIGTGKLQISPDQTITEIRFETIEEGPLWCAYAVTYKAGESDYRVEFRLDAGKPYVRIDEHSRLCHDAHWAFDIYPGFQPNRAAYGHHSTRRKTRIFDLEYSGRQHLGDVQAPDQSIHFFKDDFEVYSFLNNQTCMGLCVLQDGDWTYIAQNPISMLPGTGPSLLWKASCKAGRRIWLVFFGAAADHVADLEWHTTPAAKLHRKFETSLDWVKDLVLEWEEGPDAKRPYAVCTREDLARARRLFRSWAPLKRYGEFLDRDAELVLGQYQHDGHYPLNGEHREDPMSAWLAKPDTKVAGKLKAGLIAGLRRRVDAFLGPEGHNSDAIVPINVGRGLRPFSQMYDILAPHLKMTKEERRYLQAAFAFLAYKSASKHYWNGEAIVMHSDHPKSSHRTAWFPSRDADWCTYNADTTPHNFHQDLYVGVGSVAMAFPGHPCAKAWVDQTLSYLEQELDNWIFKTGAYIESATYTLGTIGWLIPYFAMLKNARVKNYFLDERFQRLCYALARLQGPYDRRIQRHSFTVMGDAMYPSGYADTLAWLANLGRDDAKFSATMMGAWDRSGRQLFNPGQQGMSMYDALYIDPELPSKPVSNLHSEHFDGLGLILRSGYGTKDEVYFFIKCGKIYSHFHYDEGSFFAFAGQVPIMDEYGIQYGSGTDETGATVPGNMPRCHNGISFSNVPTDRECYNRGFVTRFMATDYADYAVCEMPVHLLYMKPGLSLWGFTGEEAPYGWWRRHILFMKPSGFFFYDEVESEFTATLDLNFKADHYDTIQGLSRVYRGRYGTDIPVCINLPTGVAARDGRMDMKGVESAFSKFSTMESADPDLKKNFYNQVSMHVPTPASTDFSWAFGWGSPDAKPVLTPLAGGAPGSQLTTKDSVTRALVAPWLKSAVEYQDAGFVYRGWAGAVTERENGVVEYAQMSGVRIGQPHGLIIEGDGPFRAVLGGKRTTLETDGQARWLTLSGVPIRSVTRNGRKLEMEKLKGNSFRISIPRGRQRLTILG